MKKITLIGLFLLSGLSIISAQIKLSFNPEEGTKYLYTQDIVQQVKQTVMGQEMPMSTEMSMTYVMDVKEKSPQEIKSQFTYQDVSYNVSSAMFSMKYNSKNPVENPSDMDKMMSDMFSAMIGKPFIVNIAPDGSVNSVSGMDAISESMVQSAASGNPMGAQIGASMKQQFNDEAMKSMFEQSLKIYPDHPVKVGDSWEIEQNTSQSGMNSIIKTKYTIKEIKNNIATIQLESEVNMKPSTAGMEGNMSGTQSGIMLVDTKTGMPVSSEISQNIKGSIKAQGMDISQDLTSKVKISTKEIK